MYKIPALRVIVLIAFFHCGLTMSFESVLPVLAENRLDAKGAGFSYLMMAVGAGAMVSVVLMAGIRDDSKKGKLFLNLGVISGVAPILLAFSPNIYFAIGSAALMGASQAGYMTLTHTMIQLVTDDSVRRRVGAVYSVHIGGIMATMNLANGAISDLSFLKIDLFNGLRVLLPADTMLTIGGILFIASVFISWFIISLRKIYQTGIPQSSLIQT